MHLRIVTIVVLFTILAKSDAQFERQRTRLQEMFQGFMNNMENVASRINSVMFPNRQREHPRRPFPPPQQSQSINQFREVPDVSNDIDFESSQHSEDHFFAPNSPNQHQFQQQPQHSQHHFQHQPQHERKQVETIRIPIRIPQRNSGGGFQNMVRNAMSRVRNLLPANRRRAVNRQPQRQTQAQSQLAYSQ